MPFLSHLASFLKNERNKEREGTKKQHEKQQGQKTERIFTRSFS